MGDYFSPYGRAAASYPKPYPTRVISGNNILELGDEQQQHLIGHTLDYCSELETALNDALSKAEGYYARLVELGDIIPEKTPEELLKEQTAQQQTINETLLSTIQKLSDKIERMETNTQTKSYSKIIETEGAEIEFDRAGDESSERGTSGRSGKGSKGTKKIQP